MFKTLPGNKKLIIMLIMIMTCLLGLGQLFAADPKPVSPTGTQPEEQGKVPKIRCDNPKYEFKEIWGGEQVKHTFIIHNDGDAALKILNVRGGCGCTTVQDYDKTIPPGGKTNVSFAVRTSPQASTKTVHPTITSNDPVNPNLRLTITGKVKKAITLEPASGVNWGTVLQNQDVTPQTVKITNNTNIPMQLRNGPLPLTSPKGAALFIL